MNYLQLTVFSTIIYHYKTSLETCMFIKINKLSLKRHIQQNKETL